MEYEAGKSIIQKCIAPGGRQIRMHSSTTTPGSNPGLSIPNQLKPVLPSVATCFNRVPTHQAMVEIKAFAHLLTNDEIAQVLNYLKATGVQTGLLFNFGRCKLEYRRVFSSKNMNPVQRIGRDDVMKSERG